MHDDPSEADDLPSPWQFGLRTIFLVFLVVASGMAALGTYGLLAIAIVLLTALHAHLVRTESGLAGARFCVILAILIVATTVGSWPIIHVARESSRRSSCANHLKQLGLALLHYHGQHGCLPPACVVGEDGKPMHSWRVLVLPYLEEESLFRAYHLDEPWDGPNNAKIARQNPQLGDFHCPSDSTDRSCTSYVAVVGPRTLWPGAKGASLEDIPDGVSETILLIELPGSGIHWMAPRDVSFDELCQRAASGGGDGLASVHTVSGGWFYHPTRVIHAVMASGAWHRLRADLSAEQLAALLTRDGGETIDWEALEPQPKLNWGRILALLVFALSSLWLNFRPGLSGASGTE